MYTKKWNSYQLSQIFYNLIITMDNQLRIAISRLATLIVPIIIFNILCSFIILYSIYSFQQFLMLSVYKINLLNHSVVNQSLCNNFISFFLFWLNNALAFLFIILHSLQNSYFCSLPHFKHFMINHYMVNSHMVFNLYLNQGFYVPSCIVYQLFFYYLYSHNLLHYYSTKIYSM